MKQPAQKNYTDPRAKQVYAIALLINRGSEPTSELIEACRDLTAAMARWARRAKFIPVVDDTSVNQTPEEPKHA